MFTFVLDGDTIKVLNGHHAERIRLSGIDCPEKGQAFWKRAKQAASELVFDKEVTIQTHGHDKYKRTLGDMILLDGTNVNHTLVKESWFWWYRKHAPGIRSPLSVPCPTELARKAGGSRAGS
ncbi:MAG: thermonuclease family protein [Nitrospirae bacterium]|nr:thermonuclease family protein [Nitrospirota bacterium]